MLLFPETGVATAPGEVHDQQHGQGKKTDQVGHGAESLVAAADLSTAWSVNASLGSTLAEAGPGASRLFGEKSVADAPDCIEILCSRAELFAEPAHVSIHRAGIDQGVIFPNVAEELFAGLHAAAALYQDCEKAEFGGGEFDGFAFYARLVPGDIDG